ncbi:helix-turn-helix transcriptional regulator [Evansella clarkii]|uniref:helix-turn-helix transcriptional regulator n=1 Tax=Evansella clarkii TaxID=79879 RepID=UPI000B44E914|nr:helix-turn-helix transcriptional regulator [Evansella clarkii]
MTNTKRNKNLIQARKDKGLTQEKLAKMLGYSGKQTVANWENGHSSPTLSAAIETAKVLEKDVTYLFGNKVQDSHTNTSSA